MPYKEVILCFKKLKGILGNKIKGFSEMTEEEIIKYTNLSAFEVAFAKKREYSEAFIFFGNKSDLILLENYIKDSGLNLIKGGRFFHLSGNSDKGKAVKILSDLYKEINPEILTIGIGDSQNDFPMLKIVDIPFLVAKYDNSYEEIEIQGLRLAKGIGPVGWNEAIISLFKN